MRTATSLFVGLAVAVAGSIADAQGLAPNAVVERHGNVTNITMPGQLAPTKRLGCIDGAAVQPDDTPPDLDTGVRQCIAEGQFDRAWRLFAVAGLEADFDARRVTDVSARSAGQMLAYQLQQSMTAEQKTRMQAASAAFLADPQAIAALCRSVAALPPPSYVPNYMILHGMNAITGTKGDPLVAPFDATATWATARKEYLRCA